jgi:hypothetical protein
MSRNEEFRSAAMFHGSRYPFEPGDIVVPQSEKGLAFATNSKEHASSFGHVFEVEPVDPDEVQDWQPPNNNTVIYRSKKGFRVKGRAE